MQGPVVALWALVAMSAVAFGTAFWRRWAPPLWVALAVGLGVRAVTVALSYDLTPRDVAIYFQNAGRLVLDGADPLTGLPRFQWNFLPLMPYIFGAEISTGLPWQVAGKIAPVLADLAMIVLLMRLGGAERGSLAAFLYAVCPLAILVTAVHGQVEPVSLALGVGALLAARRGGPGWAGLLAGLAVASKTWPVILIPGILREVPVRRWWAVTAGAVVAPLLLLASIPLFLHDSVREAVHVLTSYRSLVGRWGWAGVLNYLDVAGFGYAGPKIDTIQRVGTLVTAVAVLSVLVLFRKADAIALTAALLLAFLAVTAGFGVQYLLWPLPFVLLLQKRLGLVWALLASGWAAFFYLVTVPYPKLNYFTEDTLRWSSLLVIAAGVAAIPWRDRSKEATQPVIAAPKPDQLPRKPVPAGG
ncbi:glycosyltransferase family 87 protein [Phytohabitans rumicis]|uniref:glycosyltransferase family 87 protein n=1 Tax=Phytohabitans rumicis TaxID=1076125 RepID=UPI0015667207|nr:glycosyltransferase family 87 protein [Phytohabitans rumicis]